MLSRLLRGIGGQQGSENTIVKEEVSGNITLAREST